MGMLSCQKTESQKGTAMSHLPQIESFEEFDENDLGMYTYALKYCAEIAVAKCDPVSEFQAHCYQVGETGSSIPRSSAHLCGEQSQGRGRHQDGSGKPWSCYCSLHTQHLCPCHTRHETRECKPHVGVHPNGEKIIEKCTSSKLEKLSLLRR